MKMGMTALIMPDEKTTTITQLTVLGKKWVSGDIT